VTGLSITVPLPLLLYVLNLSLNVWVQSKTRWAGACLLFDPDVVLRVPDGHQRRDPTVI